MSVDDTINPKIAGVDLLRSASVMIKHHGVERALEVCDEREEALRRADDVMGVAAWRVIKRAIEILDAAPKPGEPTN